MIPEQEHHKHVAQHRAVIGMGRHSLRGQPLLSKVTGGRNAASLCPEEETPVLVCLEVETSILLGLEGKASKERIILKI